MSELEVDFLKRMRRRAIKLRDETQQYQRDLAYWNDCVRPYFPEPIADPIPLHAEIPSCERYAIELLAKIDERLAVLMPRPQQGERVA